MQALKLLARKRAALTAAGAAVGTLAAGAQAAIKYNPVNTIISSAGTSSVDLDVNHDGTTDFTMTADTDNGIQVTKNLDGDYSDPDNPMPYYDNALMTADIDQGAYQPALALHAGDKVSPDKNFATTTTLISANGSTGVFTIAAGRRLAGVAIDPIKDNPYDPNLTTYGFIAFKTLSTGSVVSGEILGYGYDTNTYSDAPGHANPGIVAGIPGDSNDDGNITISDFAALDAGFLLQLPATWAHGDFNGDGVINYLDYAAADQGLIDLNSPLASGEIAAHAAEFGEPYMEAMGLSGDAVPEPTSLGVLALGAAGIALYRNRRRAV